MYWLPSNIVIFPSLGFICDSLVFLSISSVKVFRSSGIENLHPLMFISDMFVYMITEGSGLEEEQ